MRFGPTSLIPKGSEKWITARKMVLDPRPQVNMPPLVIPPGFITDLASIRPRFMIGYLRPRTRLPAIWHDWGCVKGYYITESGKQISVTQKEVDDMFYWGLRSNGVGYVKAKSMYLAVRLFQILKG